MTGFKLQISGVGSNHSANWATTTDPQWNIFKQMYFIYQTADLAGWKE